MRATAARRALWLRWSWRDLRRRWVQVSAVALIIAIGTGVFAGLGGSSQWRIESQDRSYAELKVHDVDAALPAGAFVPVGTLAAAARTIAHPQWLATVEERLVAPVQVDASTAADTVIVPGRVVGSRPDSAVDLLHVVDGTEPAPGSTPPNVLLESKFADANHLPATGELRLGGARVVTYSGVGYSPEYFYAAGAQVETGLLTGPGGFAVLFTDLAAAQALSGHDAEVDDVAIRLAPGADRAAAARELADVLAPVGARVQLLEDEVGYRTLYEDARNDQTTWNAFSTIILLGASVAAFNLISRMVEAERHEIGVGMAIGAPPRLLAIRPLLVGVQVALIGAVLGVGVGLLAAAGFRRVLVDALPLPVWHTPFLVGRFAQAAALGVVLPVVATILPVWRAVRVEPVDALRSTAPTRGRRPGPLARLAAVRLPGKVTTLLPVRNVLRAPRRSLLTALGIATSITCLVAVLGTVDSLFTTFDRADAELAQGSGDRLSVALGTFVPAGAPVLTAIAAAPEIAASEPGLRLPGTVRANGREVDVAVDLLDPATAPWTPTVAAGAAPPPTGGILLAEKAAADLGVRPGDTVVLHHPRREGLSYRLVDSPVVVSGLHPDPLRFLAYMDAAQASLFELDGLANVVTVRPAPGVGEGAAKRALFAISGVTAVERTAGLGAMLRERTDQLTGVLRILEAASLALALLIAFNSAAIALDERAREEATMFAFGLRIRTVVRIITIETAIVGIVGTLLGFAGGYVATSWLVHTFTTQTLPEIGMVVAIEGSSLLLAGALGVAVVALAPSFAAHRLRTMDIPATLRVLE